MPRLYVLNRFSAGIAFGVFATLLCGIAHAQLAPEAAPAAGTPSAFTPKERAVDKSLLAVAKAEQGHALKTLERIVKIETGTGDKVGMPQLSNLLAEKLKQLGATVTLHKAEGNVVGDNVVGRFNGTGGKNLLLMAHMDTVYPRGTLAKTTWRIEGN